MTANPIHSRLPALVAAAVIVRSPMACTEASNEPAGNRPVGVYPQSQARAWAVVCSRKPDRGPHFEYDSSGRIAVVSLASGLSNPAQLIRRLSNHTTRTFSDGAQAQAANADDRRWLRGGTGRP